MRYDVLKEFHDDDFGVRNAEGEKVPIAKAVGEVFTPAAVNYPQHKTNALVADGTLRLIEKPSGEAAKAKKK